MRDRRRRVWLVWGCLIWLGGIGFSTGLAQSGTLMRPLPRPATNAALHYQRGVILLGALGPLDQATLDQPAAQILPIPPTGSLPRELQRLLYLGRPAIAAARYGAALEQCDFGTDFAQLGPSTMLPHPKPLLRAGRLVVLSGAYLESKGAWASALAAYFDALRIGRHLTHQHTFAEASAGLRLLKDSLLALRRWAVRCPDRALVGRAAQVLETLAGDLVQPAQTLASEASILRRQFVLLVRAFPDGPWAEMILDGVEAPIPQGDEAKVRAAAIAAAQKLGVPKECFESKEAFTAMAAELDKMTVRALEATAACLTLPPLARVRRGRELYRRFQQEMGDLGNDAILNAGEIGAVFARFDAETVLTRVVLALAAEKKKAYPQALADLSERFGGGLPTSPYDGSPLRYQRSDDGTQFSLAIAEVKVAGAALAGLEFSSAMPAPAPPAGD